MTDGVFTRMLAHPAPVRSAIRKFFKSTGIGSYKFRLAIGAIDRPHYGYLVYSAAKLAQKLGLPKISVVEFGVAGGNGLLSFERHAAEVEKLTGVQIEIYGFDTGKGLPPPQDYRDIPYHWSEGFYAMDEATLRKRLTRAKVCLGNIEDTAINFFAEYNPAPIGAISYDFDYYSSTVPALKMLEADPERYLPRVFCYFDDTLGTETELLSEFTGERLAIQEFNDSHEFIKLSTPFYLLHGVRDYWHSQIWIAHFFKHKLYNSFVSEQNQQAKLRNG